MPEAAEQHCLAVHRGLEKGGGGSQGGSQSLKNLDPWVHAAAVQETKFLRAIGTAKNECRKLIQKAFAPDSGSNWVGMSQPKTLLPGGGTSHRCRRVTTQKLQRKFVPQPYSRSATTASKDQPQSIFFLELFFYTKTLTVTPS